MYEFDTRGADLMEKHHRTRRLLRRYNETPSDAGETRAEVLSKLLGRVGQGTWIEPPFFCDYGENIFLGAGVFLNFNCTVLDGARVEIGEGTLLGPGVQIYATSHPLAAGDRIYDRDGMPGYHTTAAPVTIGRHVWIGGGAIILPGVTIGDGTTIGAGAVVTSSVPENVFAAGNPCRVIRAL
ncbi:sugar O-acetyltransferase [Shimia sp. CNT1-13L.2]|uniref:sugar O-acetyltransferase n=1 Tax=Shimia sp. CNT1-13L.2 TaxID=2959663 RepID=UPI0020CF46A4|nr:sugar O-acetyltransferase [Shimia sp. CNT1-13L.2]MCP9482229.1 sugar O-acetyltransferase [Shimia sp. CNT1-13L.2]